MPETPAESEPSCQVSSIRDFLRWGLSEFRAAKAAIMCTSDVSARGVDYPDVTLVVQVLL
jgi:hypothetical protein